MTYSELVLEYKKEFSSVTELVKNTDDIFSEKYFKDGNSEKKFSPPFIPGEIYSFPYLTDSKVTDKRKFIDRNPIVLCTDSYQTKENGVILSGIDLIVTPPEYRVKILGKVYDNFTSIIEKNQNHYTKGGAITPLPLTDQNLKKMLFGTGYESAVFGFKTSFIREIHILDLDDWYKLPYLRNSQVEGLDIAGIYKEYQSKLI
jgi:hypothetical protein